MAAAVHTVTMAPNLELYARKDTKAKLKEDAQSFLSSIMLAGRGGVAKRDSLESDSDDEDETSDDKIKRVENIFQLQPMQLSDVRILYTVNNSPLFVSSLIAFRGKKWHQLHQDENEEQQRRLREQVAYDHLLYIGSQIRYDPLMLDDPELRHGKHQKVLQFQSYRTSITLHTKPADLKLDINNQFRERFPQLQITLTKLRSLKRDMVDIICNRMQLEPSIAAFAHVYFERAVLCGAVKKANRRILAAACVLLSVKFHVDGTKDLLPGLWPVVNDVWGLNRQQVLEKEFHLFALMEFHLLMDMAEIAPHIQRISRTLPEPEE